MSEAVLVVSSLGDPGEPAAGHRQPWRRAPRTTRHARRPRCVPYPTDEGGRIERHRAETGGADRPYGRADRGRQREVLLRSRRGRRRRRLRILARAWIRDRPERLGRDGVQRPGRPAQEDGDHAHQADRRHVGADLGHRVPARGRQPERHAGADRRAGDRRARASIEGIKRRGKAELGDKTLLDALAPAVDELEATLSEGAGTALERAAAKARASADATKGMLAKRGRASYTGERSRDSVDAGAVGVAVMFEAVSKAWRESELEAA